MKVLDGCIISLKSDDFIPVYKEVNDEEFERVQKKLNSELYNLLKDYVFDKLNKKGEENEKS